MIAALFTGIAAGPWMRAAQRHGAIAPAVLLFLLAFRRSGERAGRLAERLVCPPVVEYSREFQARAADELGLLPENSALAGMMSDYAARREQARACQP